MSHEYKWETFVILKGQEKPKSASNNLQILNLHF